MKRSSPAFMYVFFFGAFTGALCLIRFLVLHRGHINTFFDAVRTISPHLEQRWWSLVLGSLLMSQASSLLKRPYWSRFRFSGLASEPSSSP